MEIARIQESIITREFPVEDDEGVMVDTVSITWDRNLFTGELERRQGELYANRVRDIDAKIKAMFSPPAPLPEITESSEEACAEVEKLPAVPIEQPSRLLILADRFEAEKESDAVLADIARDVLADAMACDRYGLMKAWGMTKNGETVEPTFAVLSLQPVTFLRDLLAWMRRESLPKERTRGMSKKTTTSDSIEDGSPSDQPTLTAESQTM